jgi:hypothetical protein
VVTLSAAAAAAVAACCSDEMGDFIVGNETVDKRRERRDARVAMAAGLSTDAVAVSGLSQALVWMTNAALAFGLMLHSGHCRTRANAALR